jgi:hypothetical protein
MAELKCTQCGSAGLEPGWIGDGAKMYAIWVEGPLQRHRFGGAPILNGQSQFVVEAFRCTQCFHLEQFASKQP